MILELATALALVLANGFFVATEFAVTRLRPTQVDEFVRQGRPGARSARHAVAHIDAYLSACQLGITLASLGLGALGKPAFEELLEPVLGDAAAIGGFGVAALVAFVVITMLHVVVGELSPKSLAISRTQRTSLLLAPPMRLFYLATKPAVDLLNAMGNLLLRPFGIPPASEAGHAPHSEDELRELLRHSAREGLIETDESELTERVFAFGDTRAREVMVPRPHVATVSADVEIGDVALYAEETGRTRFPLCEPDGGLDSAFGVVHVKDLMPALGGRDVALREIARPLVRIHESMRLDEVLRRLRSEHQQIALVADEHGTVVGLVTVEDVLEELVGEIEDEFDPEAADLVAREGDALVLSAAAPLRLVERELGVILDGAHEATIGGHLLERLGRLPRSGDTVELNGLRAEVTEVNGERIERLRLEPT